MRTGRIVGWGLLLLAAAALGWEVIAWGLTGNYEVLLPGRLWASIDRPSLNLTQAVVQRYILPELWDYLILPLLLAPLWLVLAVPGLLLALLGRYGRRKFR
ncbi:MAG: hypothetical protein ACTSXZ_09775 [Alphaproteobacteria bacterium]